MDADGRSYMTASGGSAPVQRDLASSPAISVDTASFHTPEPLESDYQRVLDLQDYGHSDNLSSRILKQATHEQEDDDGSTEVENEITKHTDHFVPVPDQPKLALADSVQPTQEKAPITNSQFYNDAPPASEVRRRHQRTNETTPLLTGDQQNNDDTDSSKNTCCNIV